MGNNVKENPVKQVQKPVVNPSFSEIVKTVENAVIELTAKGANLPKDYSAPNALRSAALILAETTDKDKRPVLESCSRPSIINALLKMVVQGLNPIKNQCYFVPYAGKLSLMRSYAGNVLLAKRAGLKTIHARVVRNGDIFEFGIENGICVIKKHESKIQNLDNEIIAAYAVINYQVGEQVITNAEIMTIKQIKQSWLQSYSYKDGGIHSKFDEEMAKKTVINRACKVLINSSSDVVTDIDIDEEVATETVEESKAIDIMAFEDVPELESHECINEQQVEPTQKKDSEPKMKVQQKDILENEKLPF